MIPVYVPYMYAVVICFMGASLICAFVLWLQSQSQGLRSYRESIRDLDGGRVYVELNALEQDEAGYFIPGYGRILQTWDNTDADPIRQLPEVKRWKGKVALICYEQTETASDIKQYVISNIVPL